jgi:hypothetical protein
MLQLFTAPPPPTVPKPEPRQPAQNEIAGLKSSTGRRLTQKWEGRRCIRGQNNTQQFPAIGVRGARGEHLVRVGAHRCALSKAEVLCRLRLGFGLHLGFLGDKS